MRYSIQSRSLYVSTPKRVLISFIKDSFGVLNVLIYSWSLLSIPYSIRSADMYQSATLYVGKPLLTHTKLSLYNTTLSILY